MTAQAATISVPSLNISPTGLARAKAILDTPDVPGERTRLLPEAVCYAVLRHIDGAPASCSPAEAIAFATSFMARYPDLALSRMDGERLRNLKAYASQLHQAFAGFPPMVCEAAMALPSGALAELTYTPKVPEVIKALATEKRRLDTIRGNAICHNRERQRRETAQRAEEAFEAGRPGADERKRQVERMLKVRAA